MQRSPNGTSRLEASDLTVALQARTIIDRLSLRGEAGEFIGLIGPNGAGKTTLLRTLARILTPESGSVRLDGQDLARLSTREVAQLIAQVPQTTSLDFGFTCLEVVLMGRSPFLGRFELESRTDRRLAEEALALTGASDLAQRPITAVSGGERQRVIVARALAQQPRLLLLDEPTANLDVQHQLLILSLVQGLVREGLTAVAAIHDLDLAARYCDRLVLLNEGRVVSEGPPWAVLTPENLATAFGVRAFVAVDPLTETPTVTVLGPSQATVPRSLQAGAHVHVIAGGGRGARVLYLLYEAGYRVTTGVLNEDDTDRAVARLLGIETIAVSAFSPIDETSRRRNRALVESADIVVICPVPFGWGNIANLEDAAHARRLVVLEDQPIQARDYTDGAATALYATLRENATQTTIATVVESVAKTLENALCRVDREDRSHRPSSSTWRVRMGKHDDLPFLREMLHQAASWNPNNVRELKDMLADPNTGRYIAEWGRPNDAAVIAENADAEPVGAAWYRLFSSDEPGWGFIDASTPELAIAVLPKYRGQGIGGALLDSLLRLARRNGFSAMSLSVEPSNPAVKLYNRHGFVVVGMEQGSLTMRADLNAFEAPHSNR